MFSRIGTSPLWRTGTVIIASRDALPARIDSLLSATPVLRYQRLHERLDSLRRNGFDPNYWEATRMTGHWNPATHRFLAKYLAENVRALHR